MVMLVTRIFHRGQEEIFKRFLAERGADEGLDHKRIPSGKRGKDESNKTIATTKRILKNKGT